MNARLFSRLNFLPKTSIRTRSYLDLNAVNTHTGIRRCSFAPSRKNELQIQPNLKWNFVSHFLFPPRTEFKNCVPFLSFSTQTQTRSESKEKSQIDSRTQIDPRSSSLLIRTKTKYAHQEGNILFDEQKARVRVYHLPIKNLTKHYKDLYPLKNNLKFLSELRIRTPERSSKLKFLGNIEFLDPLNFKITCHQPQSVALIKKCLEEEYKLGYELFIDDTVINASIPKVSNEFRENLMKYAQYAKEHFIEQMEEKYKETLQDLANYPEAISFEMRKKIVLLVEKMRADALAEMEVLYKAKVEQLSKI